ncbi:MAG: dapb2 [Planctomycetota bacterium]|nr:dapb2 [Planctomycetota bacterium]
MRPSLAITALAAGLAIASVAHADEGMWVFNNLPLKSLKEKYGFEPSKAWIDHLRLSSVRFNSGGSGSFVSPDGLVMTNHHVGADTLQKISTKDKDFYKDGFLARTKAEEVKAPDLELNVLIGIEDVTDKVNEELKEGLSGAEFAQARRKVTAKIESESKKKTGLRSDVVTLYQGGQYHLYTYKTYTDVRLVMAPEFDIAFFGGDPDNFEFPRYDLDVCFFRAYENDKPAKVEHHLKWSPNGSKEGDLIFVAGHPGRTNRLNTLAHLQYLRDTGYPLQLSFLFEKERFLSDYGKLGPEELRQSKEDLFGVQNSRKARVGGLGGLKDEAFMGNKAEKEQALRGRIKADEKKQAKYGAAWDKITYAQATAAEILKPFNFLERGLAFDAQQFQIARSLLRLAEESAKPNGERLPEYRDSARPSLELALFSEAPVYPEYEKAKLAHSLAYWKKVSPDDPRIERVLKGRSPEQAAKELIDGSKLADVAVRRKIAEGGSRAIEQSDDSMIKLAKLVDADARAVRKRREEQVEGVEASQYALIAKAIYEDQGDTVYPDATFTLRLAFGTIKGYTVDGKKIPAYTTIAGAFEHAEAHGNKPPYELPPSWIQAKKEGRLNLQTPLNFVSTADIIGGNSGSPVVNKDNEVVGLIFDGNIQSLVLDFGYEDKVARAVSVDSRGIVEALRSVYRAEDLLRELTGK